MLGRLRCDHLLGPVSRCPASFSQPAGHLRPFAGAGRAGVARTLTTLSVRRQVSRSHCQRTLQRHVQCSASNQQEPQPQKNTEFGYSRKDVLLIGFGIFGGGFGLYYGLQAVGVPAGYAGNYVQLFVVLGLCVGWIGSYIFRVANKDMTYVKQLENYEEEVMQKRLEEMPESEREKLFSSVAAENERRQARKKEQQKQ